MRLVHGFVEDLKAGNDTLHYSATEHAEGGILQHRILTADAFLRRGELNAPFERCIQRFPTVEVQHIRLQDAVVYLKAVAGLPVKQRQPVIKGGVHVLTPSPEPGSARCC